MKKFFEQRKIDKRFKGAGAGHKLGDASSSSSTQSRAGTTAAAAAAAAARSSSSAPPRPANAAQARAAEAALKRLEQQPARDAVVRPKRLDLEKAREEGRQNAQRSARSAQSPSDAPSSSVSPPVAGNKSAVKRDEKLQQTVQLVCPSCNAPFPSPRFCDHFRDCDPLEMAIHLIHTHAEPKGSEQNASALIQGCIAVLTRYIDNVLAHPTETKYHRFPAANKIFLERVAVVSGASSFLNAIGFQHVEESKEDGTRDLFFRMSLESAADGDRLKMARERLVEGPLTDTVARQSAEVYRDAQLINAASSSASSSSHVSAAPSLSRDFFSLSAADLRRRRDELVLESERSTQLRTRAMREQDAQESAGKPVEYAFGCLRFRLPLPSSSRGSSSVLVQGVFRADECVSDLIEFIRTQCVAPTARSLTLGQLPSLTPLDPSLTLVQARLLPASLLVVKWIGDERPPNVILS